MIHQKEVLVLFGCVLPFAMIGHPNSPASENVGWWAVPIVTLVTFTLYGIDGIGTQLEDPFGYDRNDIKMDAIIETSRQACIVVLNEWKKREQEMFAKDEGVSFFQV